MNARNPDPLEELERLIGRSSVSDRQENVALTDAEKKAATQRTLDRLLRPFNTPQL